ncbi:radical SAM protein [Desulfonatronovibrio hydrogenovorans]|uniref:radical SAM protein n=1 Tax=Desulfonatronovibrio hydrogenovorans TaxID=53245 RepID=UPI0004913C67|nr:radical SAM protein [Desulfonatronovibrio hydrogenovorans]
MFESDSTGKAWDFLRGFEPASLCDWPGKVSAVLFFGGCNLRCPTCHNSSIAWNPSNTPILDHQSLLKRIGKNRKWLDGLVLSGGEVTILPGFEDLLQTISLLGLPVKIDTNGLKPEAISLALKYDCIHKIAVDVKGPWDKYPNLCGGAISSGRARGCASRVFRMAQACPERFMFRCTRVPGLTEDDIRTVSSYLPGGFELNVQKYIRP